MVDSKLVTKYLPVLAALTLTAGCLTEVEPELDTEAQESLVQNGVRLNGVRLNGVRLNGVSLNGARLNGVRLTGNNPAGLRLTGASLVGSRLTSLEGNAAVPVSVGTTWDGQLSDGSILPLRIDAISRGTDVNTDVTMYRVSFQTSAGWLDLCEPTSTGPTLALAVAGTWNANEGVAGGGAYESASGSFTFACRGTAIAKCVEMGYKPWTGRTGYLATCTRALRGDFCGDGRAYTVDGTRINIYDSADLQVDTESWEHEADWSPNGAECISSAKVTRFYQTVFQRPTCLETLRVKRCPGFGSTVKIKTELPPLL